MPPKDKVLKTRETLYNNLQKDGYKIGNYDEFETKLKDSGKRRKLYDNLVSDGYKMDDYDSFIGVLGFAAPESSPFTTLVDKVKEVGATLGENIKETANKIAEVPSQITERYKALGVPQTDEQAFEFTHYPTLTKLAEETEQEFLNSNEYKELSKAIASAPTNERQHLIEQLQSAYLNSPSVEKYAQEVERIALEDEASKNPLLKIHLLSEEIQKRQKQLEEIKPVSDIAPNTDFAMLVEAYEKDKSPENYNQLTAALRQKLTPEEIAKQKTWKAEEKRLKDEISDLNKQLSEPLNTIADEGLKKLDEFGIRNLEEQVYTYRQNAANDREYAKYSQQNGGNDLYYEQSKRLRGLQTAEKLLKNLKGIANASSENGFSSLWQGIKNNDFEDLLSLGLTSISENVNLTDIAERIDKGENVSPDERYAVEVYGLYHNLASQKELPVTYGIGQSFIQSLPFMVEIATTGGLRSAVGKGVSKSIGKGLAKSIPKLSSKATEAIAKGTGYAVGTLSAVPVTPMTYKTAFERQLGNYHIDLQGNVKKSERAESLPESLGWASLQTFITLTAEDGTFVTAKGMKYTGSSVGKALGLTKSVKANSKVGSYMKNLQKHTRWNGFLEEIGEEYDEALLTNLLVPATATEKDNMELYGTSRWDDFFDPKKALEIIGSIGLTQILMSAPAKVNSYYQSGKAKADLKITQSNLPESISRKMVEAMNLPDFKQQQQAIENIDFSKLQDEEIVAVHKYIMSKNRYDILKGRSEGLAQAERMDAINQQLGSVSNGNETITIGKDAQDNQYIVLSDNGSDGVIVMNAQTGEKGMIPRSDLVEQQEHKVKDLQSELQGKAIEEMEQENEASNLQDIEEEIAETPASETTPQTNTEQQHSFGDEVTVDGEHYKLGNELENGSWIAQDETGRDVVLSAEKLQVTSDTLVPEQAEQPKVTLQVDDKEELGIIQQEDGTAEIDKVYTSEKQAQAIANKLNEQYPNSTFEVINKTDADNPFAKAAYTIKAIPKAAQHQEAQLQETDEEHQERIKKYADTLSEYLGYKTPSEPSSPKQSAQAKQAQPKKQTKTSKKKNTAYQDRLYAASEKVEDVTDMILLGIANGSYKFKWKGDSKRRGIAQELGFTKSHSEMRSRISILSNEGFTADSLAEHIWMETDMRYDDTEIRNEIIDILLRVTSKTQALEELEERIAKREGIEDYYLSEEEQLLEDSGIEQLEDTERNTIYNEIIDQDIEERIEILTNLAVENGATAEDFTNLHTLVDLVDFVTLLENEKTSNERASEGSDNISLQETDTVEGAVQPVRQRNQPSEEEGTGTTDSSRRTDVSPTEENLATSPPLTQAQRKLADKAIEEYDQRIADAERKVTAIQTEHRQKLKEFGKQQAQEMQGSLFGNDKPATELFDVSGDYSDKNMQSVFEPLKNRLSKANEEREELKEGRDEFVEQAELAAVNQLEIEDNNQQETPTNHAQPTTTIFQSDSEDVPTTEQVGEPSVPSEPRGSRPNARPALGADLSESELNDNLPEGESSLNNNRRDSAGIGEQVDTEVSDGGQPELYNADSGNDTGRNSTTRTSGADGRTEQTGIGNSSGEDAELAERIKRQHSITNVPIRLSDVASIEETLPILTPEQQEDVLKAEKRFFTGAGEKGETGFGMLFTNGTGTGKTFTGVGTIQRFILQGKDQIIIVVPNQKILADWVDTASHFFGITAIPLKDTKDAGKGINITTYANYRENNALNDRSFDLILYDECHYLNQNEAGSYTAAQKKHGIVAINVVMARYLAKQEFEEPEYPKQREDESDRDFRSSERYESYQKAYKQYKEDVENRAVEIHSNQPKVVFLSATPFAYLKSLGYADGSLFTIEETFDKDEGFRGYNVPDRWQSFMVENFGFRMRYNKLTVPENAANVHRLEQLFHDKLVKSGAISGRSINVPFDYSRDFFIVQSGLGAKLDEGIAALYKDDRLHILADVLRKKWTYVKRSQFLEAAKAAGMKKHIDLLLDSGKKVVVFHDFLKENRENPLRLEKMDIDNLRMLSEPERKELDSLRSKFLSESEELSEKQFDRLEMLEMFEANERIRATLNDSDKIERYNAAVDVWNREYKQFTNLDFSGIKSPINYLTKAYGSRVGLFNGTIPKNKRIATARVFNTDNSGLDIILVQRQAGKEGISFHDTTSVHQRVLINLGLPTAPTDAIQIEGRIYRIYLQSNAIFEYPILNTNFESMAFAYKVATRSKTAENLALGTKARKLETAFKEGYQNAIPIEEVDIEALGTGTKEADAAIYEEVSPYRDAVALFSTVLKNRKKREQREGIDYFATPEPVGFKMVEFLNARDNDAVLEPSAGHGAIARFFGENLNATVIEPSYTLRSKLALNVNAKIVETTFEDYYVGNKFDGIVMNPPFGTGGKTAIEHLEKAFNQLRDGGRIVAIIPNGGMADKRLEAFLYGEDKNGKLLYPNAYLRADIKLPSIAFDNAGTRIYTRLLIIDRIDEVGDSYINTKQLDYSRIEDIQKLFDELEFLDAPERYREAEVVKPVISTVSDISIEPVDVDSNNEIIKPVESFTHSKTNEVLFIAKFTKEVGKKEFLNAIHRAKMNDGFWSKFAKGFLFKSEDDANKFRNEINNITDNNIELDELGFSLKGVKEFLGLNEGKRILDIKGGAAIKNFVDREIYLKVLQDKVKKLGGVVNDKHDIYNDMTLSIGRSTDRILQFENNQFAELVDISHKVIDAVGSDWYWSKRKPYNGKTMTAYDALEMYLRAKDIVEAQEKGYKERGREGFERAIGISPEDFVMDYEIKFGHSLVVELWSKVRTATSFSIDTLREAGALTAEELEEYKDRKYYVPQRGWKNRDLDDTIYKYIRHVGEQLYEDGYSFAAIESQGRSSLSSNPMPYIQSMAHTSVIVSEKNRYKKKALKLVTDNLEVGRANKLFDLKRTWYVSVKDSNGKPVLDSQGKVIWEEVYKQPDKRLFDEDAHTKKQISALQRDLQDARYANDWQLIDELKDKIALLKQYINVETNINNAYTLQRTQNEFQQHEVLVWHKDQQYVLLFNDERASNAINKADYESVSGYVQNWFGKGTRWLAAVNTSKNPSFAVFNFIRDFGFANLTHLMDNGIVYSGKFNKNVFNPKLHAAIYREVSNSKNRRTKYDYLLRQFFEDGSATGYSFLKDLDQLKRNIEKEFTPKRGNNPVKWTKKGFSLIPKTFAAITEYSELITRFSTYVTSREVGKSRHQAAVDAKNVTVNFNRKGTMSPTLNMFYMFFNATIQGGARIVDVVSRNKAKFAGVAATLYLMGFLNTLFTLPDGDDDENRKFSEFDRKQNIIIGGVKIPLPHFFRAFWGAGVHTALAFKGEKDTKEATFDIFKDLGNEFVLEQFNLMSYFKYNYKSKSIEWDSDAIINILPSLVKPFGEVYINKDFTGRTIYDVPYVNADKIPEAFWSKPDIGNIWQQISYILLEAGGGDRNIRKLYNTETGNYISDWFNVNPETLEHLFTSYTGGTGRFFNDSYKTIDNAINGKFESTTVPVLNRFVKQYDEDKAFLKDYYRLTGKIGDIEFARDETKKAIIGKNGERYDKALEEYKKLLSSDRYVTAMKAKIYLKNTMDKINKILGRLDEEKDEDVVLDLKAERTRLMKQAKGYLEEME